MREVKIDSVKAHISEAKDVKELTEFCYSWLVTSIRELKAKRVFLPAGSTPISLYKLMEEKPCKELSSVTFVQIDDVISGSKRGVFKRFFEEHLPSFISQFEFIDADVSRNAGADIALLGLGLNGHVAFHEPHLPKDFTFGTVDLSLETIKNLKLEPAAKGKSYGLGSFLACKKVLMISQGASKALITAETLNAKSGLPSSALLSHKDFTLAGDEAAFSFLESARCPVEAMFDTHSLSA